MTIYWFWEFSQLLIRCAVKKWRFLKAVQKPATDDNRFKVKEKLKVEFEIVKRTEDKIEKILKFNIANLFLKLSTLINFVLFETAMMFWTNNSIAL